MSHQISDYLADRLPLSAYCRMVNLRNALRGKKHRVRPFDANQILVAEDGDTEIHLCRRPRHNRYKRGVIAGTATLARDYHLDTIPLKAGDVLIDCGANIGELGVWAAQSGLSYIAFEPEETEARCCDLNNYRGEPETRRQALWNTATTLTFYSLPASADSSVFDSGGGAVERKVSAVPLDEAVDLSDIEGTVVFKVEAEGAEPEVLQGAKASLARINWIAIDCGFERGPEKAHTFVETNNYLLDHGFRLRRAQFKRVTALYQNTQRS